MSCWSHGCKRSTCLVQKPVVSKESNDFPSGSWTQWIKKVLDLWLSFLLFVLLLSVKDEPEKRRQHAAVERLRLMQGKCTCPSCHRWLSQSPSFPEKKRNIPMRQEMTHRYIVHRWAQSHLSVYVSISVDVIEVKCPLKLFSHCPSQQYRQPWHKVLAAVG